MKSTVVIRLIDSKNVLKFASEEYDDYTPWQSNVWFQNSSL